MSRQSHRVLQSLVAGLSLGYCLLSPSSAHSDEPRASNPAAGISARLGQLEKRVHDLETRLGAFEKVGLTPARDGAFVLTANGARVHIARDGSVTVGSALPQGRAAFPVSNNCDLPFSIDAKGIKHFKPECLEDEPGSACDPPYQVDASGIRRFKQECLGRMNP